MPDHIDLLTSDELEYIHNNPVAEELVFKPEQYEYSSAKDYSGENGILDGVIVVDI